MTSKALDLNSHKDAFESLGLTTEKEQSDFLICLDIAIRMSQGASVSAAAAAVGLSRQRLYESYWKELRTKATQYLFSSMVNDISSTKAYVAQKWGDIVRKQVTIALEGETDADKTKAATWIVQTFNPLGTVPDEKDDRINKYIGTVTIAHFNPQLPMKVEEPVITVPTQLVDQEDP